MPFCLSCLQRSHIVCFYASPYPIEVKYLGYSFARERFLNQLRLQQTRLEWQNVSPVNVPGI